jgi:uncharacterized phage infection (PIP) family protein YhgE
MDIDLLRNAGTTLKVISDDFGSANARGVEVAALLGDTSVSSDVQDLASVIRDFDKKWDDRRNKLKEGIDALSDAATQIADTFQKLDEQLADALDPGAGQTP